MTRIEEIVPALVHAEKKLQKVLSNKKSNPRQIAKAEQDFNETVSNIKTEFNKSISEMTTKYQKSTIVIPQFSRRGAVHAR